MTKSLFLLPPLLLGASLTSQATSAVNYSCTTQRIIEGSDPSTFSFSLADNGTKSLSLLATVDGNRLAARKDSALDCLCTADYKVSEDKKGLTITCNENGMIHTTIYLTKDSDYTRGYIGIQYFSSPAIRNLDSELTCTR